MSTYTFVLFVLEPKLTCIIVHNAIDQFHIYASCEVVSTNIIMSMWSIDRALIIKRYIRNIRGFSCTKDNKYFITFLLQFINSWTNIIYLEQSYIWYVCFGNALFVQIPTVLLFCTSAQDQNISNSL